MVIVTNLLGLNSFIMKPFECRASFKQQETREVLVFVTVVKCKRLQLK